MLCVHVCVTCYYGHKNGGIRRDQECRVLYLGQRPQENILILDFVMLC